MLLMETTEKYNYLRKIRAVALILVAAQYWHKDKLKAAKEKLMASAQSLFTKVYEQSQGAAGNAGAGPDMSGQAGQTTSDGGNNDDVVDGDYREV